MSAKVLALGPPAGALAPFVAKLRALHAKHAFSFAVVAGDFFGPPGESEEDEGRWEDLLAGRLDFPLTTYISAGEHALPARIQQKVSQTGGEICSNVFYIGNAVLKTSEGLRIGAFSAVATPEDRTTFLSSPHLPVAAGTTSGASAGQPSLAELQAAEKAKGTAGLDILLLPAPPPLLFPSSPAAPAELKSAPVLPELEEIVRRSKARYVLFPPSAAARAGGDAVQGGFFEREPYPASSSTGSDGRFTRAIQLGAFTAAAPAPGGPKPPRSFYAFNLAPLPTPLPPKPANATPNPFEAAGGGRGQKREREPLQEQGFIWSQSGGRGGGQGGKRGRGGDRRQGGERWEKKEPIMMAECWFCLSNPKVTKHLIASIGEEVYVTLPKGPLVQAPKEGKVKLVNGAPVEEGGEKGVPGGGHVLIIPISHHTTVASIPDDERETVNSEIGGVIDSLRECYKAYGAAGVGFEVGRMTQRGGHAHIQFVPVPLDLAGGVEEAFRVEGAKLGLQFEEAKTLDGKNGKDNYFRLLLPDGRQLVAWLEPKQRFDLQFGRVVLANMLGIQNRIDWKACVPAGGEADEKRDAAAFKKAYAKFDAAS